MPQMSPMNWIMISVVFMTLMSIIKSIVSMNQKNTNQSNYSKNVIQNTIKW